VITDEIRSLSSSVYFRQRDHIKDKKNKNTQTEAELNNHSGKVRKHKNMR